VIDDETVVESREAGYELVLLAAVRPVAKARITLRLHHIGPGRWRIEMSEVAVSVPLRWLPDARRAQTP
jgi:hypothetical protein